MVFWLVLVHLWKFAIASCENFRLIFFYFFLFSDWFQLWACFINLHTEQVVQCVCTQEEQPEVQLGSLRSGVKLNWAWLICIWSKRSTPRGVERPRILLSSPDTFIASLCPYNIASHLIGTCLFAPYNADSVVVYIRQYQVWLDPYALQSQITKSKTVQYSPCYGDRKGRARRWYQTLTCFNSHHLTSRGIRYTGAAQDRLLAPLIGSIKSEPMLLNSLAKYLNYKIVCLRIYSYVQHTLTLSINPDLFCFFPFDFILIS